MQCKGFDLASPRLAVTSISPFFLDMELCEPFPPSLSPLLLLCERSLLTPEIVYNPLSTDIGQFLCGSLFVGSFSAGCLEYKSSPALAESLFRWFLSLFSLFFFSLSSAY